MYNGIQDARLNEAIARRFGMAQDAPSPQVGGEVQPSFEILDPPADLQLLAGIVPWWAMGATVAVAAKNGYALLWNNPAMKRIITVREIRVSAATAGTILVGRDFSAVSLGLTAAVRYSRDFRLNINQTGAGTPRFGSDWFLDVAVTQYGAQINHAAAVDGVYSQPIILGPGSYLYIVNNTANEVTRFAFSWEERTAQQGELVA